MEFNTGPPAPPEIVENSMKINRFRSKIIKIQRKCNESIWISLNMQWKSIEMIEHIWISLEKALKYNEHQCKSMHSVKKWLKIKRNQ